MSGSYSRARAPMSQALAAGLSRLGESMHHPGYADGRAGRRLQPQFLDDPDYMRAYARGQLALLLNRDGPQIWERKQ